MKRNVTKAGNYYQRKGFGLDVIRVDSVKNKKVYFTYITTTEKDYVTAKGNKIRKTVTIRGEWSDTIQRFNNNNKNSYEPVTAEELFNGPYKTRIFTPIEIAQFRMGSFDK